MSDKIKGACLCGKVRYAIKNNFERIYLCHCKQCQKTSGSEYVSNLFGEAGSLDWLAGEDLVTRFDYPGRGFTNAFCRLCGAGVPYLNQNGTAIIVQAGSLEGMPSFGTASKIFTGERAQWAKKSATADSYEKFPD